jgi:translation initiation factor IF-1
MGNKLNMVKIKTDDAIVIKLLPNAKFKLKLISNDKIITGFISGKLYINNIRILLGDKVQVDSNGRIIYRYIEKK